MSFVTDKTNVLKISEKDHPSKFRHKDIDRFSERASDFLRDSIFLYAVYRDGILVLLNTCTNPKQLNGDGAVIFNGEPDTINKSEGHQQHIMAKEATVRKTNGTTVQKMEVVKTENPILSLEKRIQKVEELNIVIGKWRKLTEARKNMKSFTLGNDGIGASITMQDATGKEFKTSNSLVVNTVLETVLTELGISIAKTEEQINFAA